jgi:signal peptidase I
VDPEQQPAPDSAAPEMVATDEVPVASPPKKTGNLVRSIVEWGLVILVAVSVAVLLRTYVVQTFWIPSGSMYPTLQTNDRVLVNKLSYRMHSVHRGDIVVFTTPPKVDKTFKDLVKRVVGLPGDEVSASGGHIDINGKPLDESYLPAGTTTDDFGPIKVPTGSYFVMGDNRSHSADSRVFGPIPKRTIVGRAFFRIWPLNRIGFL